MPIYNQGIEVAHVYGQSIGDVAQKLRDKIDHGDYEQISKSEEVRQNSELEALRVKNSHSALSQHRRCLSKPTAPEKAPACSNAYTYNIELQHYNRCATK